MTQAAVAPSSFLNAILESASSLDAHVDADVLVGQIVGDKTATCKRSAKALNEMKDLAKRAPTAVVASQDAVKALLIVVTRLSSAALRDDMEDDSWAEPLQDTLETLGHLIGENGPDKADQASASRAETVAELIIRYTENGKQLLRLLAVRDTSTRGDALVLLQRVYRWMPTPIENAMLADPLSTGQLMQILQTCQEDYLRNECLGFLFLITASNAELQMIVTMQGLVETIFLILEEEDLTIGTKVARDLLHMLINLVGNTTCQKYIRESDGITLIVSAMSTAVSGRRSGHDGDDENEEESGGLDSYDRADVPEEARWGCLSLLTDAALALSGRPKQKPAGSGEANGSIANPAEIKANQDALVRAGVVGLCKHLPDARIAEKAKLQIATLLDALSSSALAAQALQSDRLGVPPLSSIVVTLLDVSTSPALQTALGRVTSGILSRHPDLQSFVCSSLSPQLDMAPGGIPPPGRQVVALLSEVERGRAGSAQIWFALHLILATLLSNPDVQSVCASLSVSTPESEGAAVGDTFLELLLRAFAATARAYTATNDDRLAALSQGEPSYPRRSGPKGAAGKSSVAEVLESPAVAILAMLKLLAYWLASCPDALVPVATSPVTVPIITDLTCLRLDSSTGLQESIEGLASLLLGVLIQGDASTVDVGSLMALLAARVGIEDFHRKVEVLLRSDAMQRRPPKSLEEFALFDPAFRDFTRSQHRAIQRRMVQLYVTGGVAASGVGLSEDVADHYKQIIRVQDSELKEVRHENEQLRREVENFMTKSLQASSFALVEKVDVLTAENAALRSEVEDLTQEVSARDARLEREAEHTQVVVTELEQQLQSMVVSYEQVDQTAATLRRQNAELQAVVQSASKPASDERSVALEKELAATRLKLQEMQNERGDLLDALGRLVAASSSPAAHALVAPLGLEARER